MDISNNQISLILFLSLLIAVILVMVGLKHLLSDFLLSLVDICVKFVSVLSNREFLVIIDWNVNFLFANRLIFFAVELCYIGMLK